MKVVIQKYYTNRPRNHLARVQIMLDGKQVTTVDGIGCEFVSEVEAITTATEKTARVMALALGCEVSEEVFELSVVVKE